MKLKLIDVGRDKYNGTMIIPDETMNDPDAVAEEIYHEIRVKSLLRSSGVEVIWDAKKKRGTIHAGMYTVGTVEVA
jgi:hypothetical protein